MIQKSKIVEKYNKKIAKVLLLVLFVVAAQFYTTNVQAASLTQISDTMSRLHASTASDHEFKFVIPGGLAGSQTITFTFSGGFTSGSIGAMVDGDFDFAEGNTGTCSSATFTEKAIHSSPTSSQFSISGAGQVVTITAGSAATITAGRCVRLRAGLNAIDTTGSSGPGSHQILNGAIGASDTIAINVNSGTDTGTAAVEILANDQITISATVDPTITFTLTDSTPTNNAVGFGTLTIANACYAIANESNTTCTLSDPAAGAAVAAVTTNASGGYVLTYVGDTLKSGSDSISPATITGDADGTPNSSQFASSYETNGSSTITTSYAKASNNWDYLGSTTTATTIVSRTTPTNTETIKIHYLANIAGTTPAGSYSTTITYIATGTF